MMTMTSFQPKKVWTPFYPEYTGLTKENQHILKKMYRYIRTFPLKAYEIEQIKKDLIGMATESQERDESFLTTLGKEPREFCNDLIFSIGGICTPGGRKLLRAAACYFQIIAVCGFIAFPIGLNDYVFGNKGLFGSCLVAIFLYVAGSRALKYCADISMAHTAMKWAIATLIVELFQCVPGMIALFLMRLNPLPLYCYIIAAAIVVLNLGMSSIYILGAWRNRPQSEE